MSKLYLKQSTKDGLFWHCNVEDKHLTLRFAGKPSLILEEYINKYGEKKGKQLYAELLQICSKVGEKGKSPFVLYINNIKN